MALQNETRPLHITSRTADLPLEDVLQCVSTPDDPTATWSPVAFAQNINSDQNEPVSSIVQNTNASTHKELTTYPLEQTPPSYSPTPISLVKTPHSSIKIKNIKVNRCAETSPPSVKISVNDTESDDSDKSSDTDDDFDSTSDESYDFYASRKKHKLKNNKATKEKRATTDSANVKKRIREAKKTTSTVVRRRGRPPKKPSVAHTQNTTNDDDDILSFEPPIKRPKQCASPVSNISGNNSTQKPNNDDIIVKQPEPKNTTSLKHTMPVRRLSDATCLVKHILSDERAPNHMSGQNDTTYCNSIRIFETWQNIQHKNAANAANRVRKILDEKDLIDPLQSTGSLDNNIVSSLLALVTCAIYDRSYLDSDEKYTKDTSETELQHWTILGHNHLPAHCFISCAPVDAKILLASDTNFTLHDDQNIKDMEEMLQWHNIIVPSDTSCCIADISPCNLYETFLRLSNHRARLMWSLILLYHHHTKTINISSFCFVWRFILNYRGKEDTICLNNRVCSVLAALCDMPDGVNIEAISTILLNEIQNPIDVDSTSTDFKNNFHGSQHWTIQMSSSIQEDIPMPWLQTIRLYRQMSKIRQLCTDANNENQCPQPLYGLGRLNRYVLTFPTLGFGTTTKVQLNLLMLNSNK